MAKRCGKQRLRAEKKQSTKLFVAENGMFGTPFLTPKIPPKKFMWAPFCVLSRKSGTSTFFWAPKMGVLGGGQTVFVKNVYVLFPSLKETQERQYSERPRIEIVVRKGPLGHALTSSA